MAEVAGVPDVDDLARLAARQAPLGLYQVPEAREPYAPAETLLGAQLPQGRAVGPDVSIRYAQQVCVFKSIKMKKENQGLCCSTAKGTHHCTRARPR